MNTAYQKLRIHQQFAAEGLSVHARAEDAYRVAYRDELARRVLHALKDKHGNNGPGGVSRNVIVMFIEHFDDVAACLMRVRAELTAEGVPPDPPIYEDEITRPEQTGA